jgi:hypothetical protein
VLKKYLAKDYIPYLGDGIDYKSIKTIQNRSQSINYSS